MKGRANGGYRNGCVAPGGDVNALARYGCWPACHRSAARSGISRSTANLGPIRTVPHSALISSSARRTTSAATSSRRGPFMLAASAMPTDAAIADTRREGQVAERVPAVDDEPQRREPREIERAATRSSAVWVTIASTSGRRRPRPTASRRVRAISAAVSSGS